MEKLLEHANDGLVLAGWNPGEGRTLPPMSHATSELVGIRKVIFAPTPEVFKRARYISSEGTVISESVYVRSNCKDFEVDVNPKNVLNLSPTSKISNLAGVLVPVTASPLVSAPSENK